MRDKDKLPDWTPFQLGTIPEDAPFGAFQERNGLIFVNSRYQVNMTPWDREAPPFPGITWLSIKRRDKRPIMDWRELQRIKNELCGPECEAVQIFPAETRLVDASNQMHLYVFEPGYVLPFGFKDRFVTTVQMYGSKQRAFEPGTEPADLDRMNVFAKQAMTKLYEKGKKNG